jgi:VWFA-related protein
MPTPRPLAVVMAALFAAEPVLALAQQAQKPADKPAQEAPAQTGLTFAVGTSAVAIDVVVRDKKGRLVKDLTAADFELTEDGAKQQIESFTVVARGAEAEPETDHTAPAAPAASAPAAAPAVPTQETPDSPAVLALVFDRMSPGGRDIAHKAALTYLAARQDGDFTGVFSIDLALHTVQNFTSDPDKIRTAIDMAATHAGTSFVSSTDRATSLQTLEQRSQDAENALMATPTGAGAGSTGANAAAQQAGSAAAAAAAARLEVGMMRSFEVLERDQQGFATSNGLLAVVQGLQRVPGRKTIVFFSEGMYIPDRVLLQFQAVIAAANRANVAVYTMDAVGLRAHSQTEQTRAEIEAAASRRMQNMGREGSGDMMMKDAERNEDLLRLNPQAGLGQLADQTGGFLVRDTNDARGSFRQIAQDMRFHYVLGYTPSNDNYDGRFRTVSVKVKRGGTDVHSRRGYFAVRARTSNPMLAYEAPAIAILDRPGPHAETFPLRGLALTFPSGGATVRVPVLVRFPGRVVKYAPVAGQKDIMAADLAVVVRVRNEYQQEVGRLSQHYQLSSPAAKVDAAKAGDILFYREADLPPGKYMLDAVAYDAGAVASSVRSFPLEVAAPGPNGADLSSLVVIDHVERVPAADRDPKNPLYFGDTLVYPNMGDPVRKAAKIMGFYFTAQAPPGAHKALLEITQGGQVVNRLTLDLAAPDATGRVQHAGTLPLEVFSPGAYELHLSLLDGAQRLATRSTSLSIVE